MNSAESRVSMSDYVDSQGTLTITKYRKFHENVTFYTQRFMDFWSTLGVFARKEAHAAFSPCPLGS